MAFTRRTVLKLAGSAALMRLRPADVLAAQVHVDTGRAFGSSWRLVLPDARDAVRARVVLETTVARIDALMSPYRADSDLGRFNAGEAVAISAETALVTCAALEMARDSDGAFDPTVAPIGRRFGFGPLRLSPDRPAGRYRDVQVSANRLVASTPGLTIDLCGIATGYALDDIGKAFDGMEFLLELGGEVMARGRHPSGRQWRAGIERPGSATLQRIVAMDGRALATSGDTSQSYRVGRRRYSHVVDPRTRLPADSGVASVSVLAATGLAADALATAAMVLGPESARPLLTSRDASALFLMRRPGGVEEVDINRFVGDGAR